MDKERKIKVLFVMTHCTKSGPIQQMLNLIKNMDRRVFTPYLITIYDEDSTGLSMLEEYKEILSHKRISISKKDILMGKTGRMKKAIDKLNPDVIHSFGVFPDYMITRLKFENHVLTSRNFVYDDYTGEYGKIMGNVLAWIHLYAIKHTKYSYCCSESLHCIYREKLKMDIPFIRNGVDVSKFSAPLPEEKTKLKKQFGLPLDKPIIVYGGVFNDRKNQEFLLQGIAGINEFQNYTFLLLGDGTEFLRLKKKYGKYENVIMPGNTIEMPAYLKASDYYISTSKSEGLPNGVLEAMASGLPVFLSDIQQHKEVLSVDPAAGITYKAGDLDDFKKHLNEYLHEDYKNMSSHAKNSVNKNFTAQIMSQNYQNLYKEIVNRELT